MQKHYVCVCVRACRYIVITGTPGVGKAVW